MVKTVEFIGSEFEKNADALKQVIMEEFSDIIGQSKVIFQNPHGSSSSFGEEKNALYIRFWSVPSYYWYLKDKKYNFPIFGEETNYNGSQDGCQPVPENKEIKDIKCPEGHIVAQFSLKSPNTLFILFDLPHEEERKAKVHLRGILKEYFELTEKAIKSRSIFAEEVSLIFQAKELLQKEREKYAEEYEKLSKQAEVIVDDNGVIFLYIGKEKQIFFDVVNDSYGVILNGNNIPFSEICAGSAKAGLAQLVGKRQFLTAFQIIQKWLEKNKEEEEIMGKKHLPPTVAIEPLEENRRSRAILEEYAKKLKRSIILHSTHCKKHEPIHDNFIHIFPWSTSLGKEYEEKTERIRYLFGLGTACPDALKIEEEDIKKIGGIPLKDDEEILFGEAHGCSQFGLNNLFIHFDAMHEWTTNAEKIFSRIMEIYFSVFLSKDAKKILKDLLQKKKKLLSLSKEKYVSLCATRIDEETRQNQKELSEKQTAIGTLSQQIAKTSREIEILKRKPPIEQADFRKKLEREFDSLAESSFVEKILVGKNRIEIHTKKLILEKRKIGRFKIAINTNSGELSCINLDTVIDEYYHHPHVEKETLCFGDITEEIYRLIERCEFAMAFKRIWSRLNMYSRGGAYILIDNWPLAEKGESDE